MPDAGILAEELRPMNAMVHVKTTMTDVRVAVAKFGSRMVKKLEGGLESAT